MAIRGHSAHDVPRVKSWAVVGTDRLCKANRESGLSTPIPQHRRNSSYGRDAIPRCPLNAKLGSGPAALPVEAPVMKKPPQVTPERL